jgi:dienelactone hydrolase
MIYVRSRTAALPPGLKTRGSITTKTRGSTGQANRRPLRFAVAAALSAAMSLGAAGPAQTQASLSLRGHPQRLHLYGTRGSQAIVVTSGDGGWMRLAPHVARALAAREFFVVGLDVKAYLESFTSGAATLAPADEPRDFKVLADYAARGSTMKPILVGVSEGAGLSLLAATDPGTQASIAGVIGLGLPDLNELGWRWKDALIYLTHGNPDEPLFSTRAIAGRVYPLPLAAIHSTHDEFVPLAEVQYVMAAAREPKQLWVVEAFDHAFSDNLPEFDRRLFEAIAWVNRHTPR